MDETQLTVALRQMWTSTEQGPALASIPWPAGNGPLQDFRPQSFVPSLMWGLVEGEFIFFHEQIFIEHPLWNKHWPECLPRSWETMRGFGPFHSLSGPWRVLGHPWHDSPHPLRPPTRRGWGTKAAPSDLKSTSGFSVLVSWHINLAFLSTCTQGPWNGVSLCQEVEVES